MNELAGPVRLVTLDRRDRHEGPPALDAYIDERGLTDRLRPVYGIDQADAVALTRLLDSEFGDHRLDLVIDDASHQLAETLGVVQHRVPPAPIRWPVHDRGLDVGSSHVATDQRSGSRDRRPVVLAERSPLSVIAFELLMAFASNDGLISRIEIDEATIHVWRGNAPLPAGPFHLETSYNPGGVSIVTSLP